MEKLIGSEFIHLSFYLFFKLQDLQKLKIQLLTYCRTAGFMGTILLAPEGINAGISGSFEEIQLFKIFLQKYLPIEPEEFKEYQIVEHAYKRLLVKIKKEIITVGDSEISPNESTAEYLSPIELRNWLDEKKSFILMDTRNRYEIEVGTFKSAFHLNIDSSREFAEKAKELAKSYKTEKIVTYCTGGIRCEKASAFLMKIGFHHVYQLKGGILNYFEKNKAAHFKGHCFVFDWRLAVDGNLQPLARSSDPNIVYGRHRQLP